MERVSGLVNQSDRNPYDSMEEAARRTGGIDGFADSIANDDAPCSSSRIVLSQGDAVIIP